MKSSIGNIRQRKDGRWEARISLGYSSNGKRRRKSIFGNSQADVRKKMIDLIKQIQDGEYLEPSKMSLSAWIKYWLLNYGKLKYQQTTYDMYASLLKNHINPELGSVKLSKLTTSDLQVFYNKLTTKKTLSGGCKISNKPLSTKTIRNIHNVIHTSLEQATKENLIKQNPSKHCILPRVEKKEMQTFDYKQIKTFLKAVKNDRLFVAYLIALSTGLRRGEILGLRWRDVNFVNNTIHINQQIVKTDKEIIIKDLKTKLSNRVLDIPPTTMKELKLHQTRQKKEKLLCGSGWVKTGLVFTDEIGQLIKPDAFYKAFKKILKEIELPDIRLHDLRHSYALMCLQEGVEIKTLQETLGHYSASFTLDFYGHASKQMKKESADKIENVINKCIEK
jgi:integrase